MGLYPLKIALFLSLLVTTLCNIPCQLSGSPAQSDLAAMAWLILSAISLPSKSLAQYTLRSPVQAASGAAWAALPPESDSAGEPDN